jgi:hypothetical protein
MADEHREIKERGLQKSGRGVDDVARRFLEAALRVTIVARV